MANGNVRITEAASGTGTPMGALLYTDETSTPVKVTKQHIVDAAGAAVDFATATDVQAVTTSLGADGSSPPTISGTGVRGWLRGIYERLTGTLTIGGTVTVANPTATGLTDAQLRAASVPVSGTITVANPTAQGLSNAELRAQAVAVTGSLNTTQTGVGTAANNPFFESIVADGVAVGVASPLPVMPKTADRFVCGVTAAAGGLTISLPPAGAGLFHHIDAIELSLSNGTAARAAAAAPIVVSTTNLNGYGKRFSSVAAAGVTEIQVLTADRPIRSAVANTATTIVLPAVPGSVWCYNVIYSTGA